MDINAIYDNKKSCAAQTYGDQGTVEIEDFTAHTPTPPPPELDGFELTFHDLNGISQRFNPPENEGQGREGEDRATTTTPPPLCRHDRPRNTSRRRYKKSLLKRPPVTKARHVIQHNYHDHANDVVDFDEFTGEGLGFEAPLKKKGGVAIPFPLKLHELLEKVDEEGLQHIVSWQPHGRAFVVREPKTFVADLMPRFFRQTKLTSFQRQLNLYGFSRLTRGPDAGGYYHELFLRGKPYLTRRMVRTKIKGTGYKAASNPACEPDFYSMSPLGLGSPAPQSSNGEESQHYRNDLVTNQGQDNIPIPIITPIASSGISTAITSNFESSQSNLGDETIISISEMPPVTSEKPFLKPRHHSKAVKMGNEHFHYMESMFHPSSEETCSMSSSTSSPLFFEKISSEETLSIHDNDEDPSQDPLSIFLEEMGGNDFDDDIVFSSCDCDQKKVDNHCEPTNIPSDHPIYEV